MGNERESPGRPTPARLGVGRSNNKTVNVALLRRKLERLIVETQLFLNDLERYQEGLKEIEKGDGNER